MNHLVITVFAQDKAGQVERIAQCIAEHGGNWLESRMSRMAGQFAGILRVGVPAEAHDELVDALQRLGKEGIRVLIAESGIEQSCTWKPIAMELVGNDRPGIVRDIAFGEGNVDFVSFFKLLTRENYSGLFVTEMWTDEKDSSIEAARLARVFIQEKIALAQQ